MPTTTISHIGICTADAARSIRFYTQALGFVHERSIDAIGAPYDVLTELPGITFSAHYLKCGDATIELIGYPNSNVTGSAERRPMNQLGFTHMTLIVDDVAATADRVLEFGGQVHPGTKIDSPYGPIVFCTDPDGVRVELMQRGA
jgi:predicted enzyme related to lactoylglutathione lyase